MSAYLVNSIYELDPEIAAEMLKLPPEILVITINIISLKISILKITIQLDESAAE